MHIVKVSAPKCTDPLCGQWAELEISECILPLLTVKVHYEIRYIPEKIPFLFTVCRQDQAPRSNVCTVHK